MREFFSSNDSALKLKLGPQFKTSLIEINNEEDSQDIFNFLDYYPLVNPRAHRIGGMD